MKFAKSQNYRLEDDALIQGKGVFSDDVSDSNQVYASFLRSPWASGKITSLDTTEASKVEGVLKIYTGEDLKARNINRIPDLIAGNGNDAYETTNSRQIPLLAIDEIKFAGEGIAFVVADTIEAAKAASEMIEIEVDDETNPPIADLEKASEPNSNKVHQDLENNEAFIWHLGDYQETLNTIDKSDHKVSYRLINNRVISNPMEPRSALGIFKDGEYTLYAPTQGPHGKRKQIAGIINESIEKIRVISKDVGGGFGTRAFTYPEQPLVLIAAKDLSRPVKWRGERSNDIFSTDAHGRDNISQLDIGFDKDYKITAYAIKTLAGMGAYLSSFAAFIPTGAPTKVFSGAYVVPKLAVKVKGIYTNTTPVDAYRGAGRPEAGYAIERLMDEAASALDIDRIKLREINFIKPSDLPYTTPGKGVVESGNFPEVLKRTIKFGDLENFPKRRKEAESKGRALGFGLAYYIEASGAGSGETAYLGFNEDKKLTLAIGSQANGQGHVTMYSQILSQQLGIDINEIEVVQGDSKLVPTGGGTGGSRALAEAGGAVLVTSHELIKVAKGILAKEIKDAEENIKFEDGVFFNPPANKHYNWDDLQGIAASQNVELKASKINKNQEASFTNGCHIVEVEIDKDTGEWKITKYSAIDDFGTIINRRMATAQVHGGAVQGMGQALLERVVYDDNGQLISGSLMDYALPRASQMPEMKVDFFEDSPCLYNPLGVKGAGEAGTIASPPAVINAIIDAIKSLDKKKNKAPTILEMPANAYSIWRALVARK